MTFIIIFPLVYFPTAIIIACLDHKRGAVPVDLTVSFKANPWIQDLSKALMLISDGKNEEAKKILERWVK